MKNKRNGKIACIFAVLLLVSVAVVTAYLCFFKVDSGTNLTGYKISDASGYIDDDLYSDMGNLNHIGVDDGTEIGFYDNEIAFIVKDGVTERNVVDSVIKDYKVKIVGKSSLTGRYLIRFDSDIYTYDDILGIAENLKSNSLVENAYPNYVMPVDELSGYYPKGKQWEGQYDDVPSGGNWGIEAIKAPQAWNYYDLMSPVDVGVLEAYGFQSDHSDLKNVVKNVISKDKTDIYLYHGTHVVGIIGAEFDNDIGINGVCPTAEISYIDALGAEQEKFLEIDSDKYQEADKLLKSYGDSGITSGFGWSNGLEYLIGKCGCKVINASMGGYINSILASMKPSDTFYDKDASEKAQNILFCYSLPLKDTLKNLLENDKEFLICQAAGNSSGVDFIKDDTSLLGYKVYEESEDGKVKTYKAGECDAKYASPLAIIEDKELRSRIIVVGAIKNEGNGGYSICSYSCGGTRVDIVAPGDNIESTYHLSAESEAASAAADIAVDSVNTEVGGYALMPGTSVSAPHVSGVAGMLCSLNPDLDGAELKDIIVKSSSEKVKGYPLLDAEAAVKELLSNSRYNEPCMYYYSGQIVDNNGSALKGVSVTAYKKLKDGSEILNTVTVSDDNGSFSFSALAGENRIVFEKSGYDSLEISDSFEKTERYLISEPHVMQEQPRYSWHLEPSIEAEDIIVSDDSNDKYPLLNTEQTEKPSDVYSIIQRDGQYSLIDYDGKLYNNKFYTSFSMGDNGEIILSSSTPENIDSGNDIIVSYDKSGGCRIDEVYVGGRGSAGWDSFYYDYSDKAVHVSGPGDPKNYGPFTKGVNIPIWGEAVNRAVLLNEKGESLYGCYYNGDFTVEPQYSRGKMSFYSDMIAFFDGNKWGYFNGKTGEQIIDFSCNGAAKTYHYMNSDLPPYMYTEGILAVYNDSDCKYVDAAGNEIIPIGEFEEVRPVHKGLAWVKQNGKWGIIKFTDGYSENIEDKSSSETANTAESLVNKTVPEIVELMGGEFELGYAYLGWYTPGQAYFYNEEVFPGMAFGIESQGPLANSGGEQAVSDHYDEIENALKNGEIDLCLISVTAKGKVNDSLTVSEGMKYSDLTKNYGDFNCNIGGAVGNVTYRIPNTNTILTFEPSDEMSKNNNNLKYYNSTTGESVVKHAELLYYDPKLLFVNVFPASKELA